VVRSVAASRALGALAGCAAVVFPLAACGALRHRVVVQGHPARATAVRFNPVSFTAVSENDFWLLGTVPCSRGSCLSIRRTTDGGRTFTPVAAPPLPRRPQTPVLRFADRSDGFAYVPGAGGAFFATHDGGATWRRQRIGTVLAFATGGGDAYLVTASCTKAACYGYRLLRSPVSANGWMRGRLPFTPDSSIVELAAHGPHVWLLATPPGSRGPHDALARSSDGGRTFTTGRGPCFGDLDGDLEPASASVVWAVCPTGMLAAAWRSTDGGVTFTGLKTPPLVNSATIAPASATTAVLARNGATTRLLRTTDGGRAWRRPAAPPPAGFTPFAGFTDAKVGYVLVQAGTRQALWRTADAGAHWYRVRV
jgi:hypothetical protein